MSKRAQVEVILTASRADESTPKVKLAKATWDGLLRVAEAHGFSDVTPGGVRAGRDSLRLADALKRAREAEEWQKAGLSLLDKVIGLAVLGLGVSVDARLAAEDLPEVPLPDSPKAVRQAKPLRGGLGHTTPDFSIVHGKPDYSAAGVERGRKEGLPPPGKNTFRPSKADKANDRREALRAEARRPKAENERRR